MVELNFYRHEVIKKKQKTIEETEIQRSAIPRLVSFPKNTSFAKMSQKVLHMYADLFDEDVIEGEQSPIKLEVRDNLPTVQVGKYGARRSATCDFCKEQHSAD